MDSVNGLRCMARRFLFFIAAILIGISLPAFGDTANRHPETIAVLQALYVSEVTAHKAYILFARKALEEKYVSVGRLFTALGTSESIHARNFKTLLVALGADVKDMPEPNIKVSDTKKNLKYALDVELSEIDKSYPQYLKKLKPEGYESAIQDITYAWKAEQQHRDLIRKMQSAVSYFFHKLVKKLDSADNYFVCQRCGSTLLELPKGNCPICDQPVSRYIDIKLPQ